MKIKAITLISVLLVGSAVSAKPVEQMTCAQAQAYAARHGMYWKDAGPDGEIPIYPVTSLEKANCGGKSFAAPQMEATLDDDHCVVGWYCNKY